MTRGAGGWPGLVAGALGLLLVSHPLFAQVVQTRVHPGDWGITDVGRVEYGEFGILLGETGPQLVVYELEYAQATPPLDSTRFRSVTPGVVGGQFVISRMQTGNRNALGGYFNIFSRSPATGHAALTAAPDGTRGLLIDCTVEGDGFCGAWIHLFDYRLAPADRQFLDARPFAALTFWVWTDRPDDQVLLKIADAAWEFRQDAPPAGHLHQFVASGRLGPRWQRVTVPLNRLDRRVDPARLASIIVQSMDRGRTRTWVRDVLLVTDPDNVPDPMDARTTPPANPPSLGPHRAVWVWNTSELLLDERETVRTVNFLVEQGVDFVFLQVPDGPDQRRSPGERILEPDRLRRLVGRLRRAGIRTYALDGAAWFANRPYHDGVVKTVEHVAAYNAAVLPEERFVGVRYDIEPYLLPGFHGPRRDRILTNLFSLVERIVETAHRHDLVVGLDIPFWYDAPNERTSSTIDVMWNGEVRPASHHLIDLVDDVTIMAYRTSGYGADGTIAHSEGEIRFAAARHKMVFVGLETGPLPDEVLVYVWGAPHRGLPPAADDLDRVLVLPAGDSVQVVWYPAQSRPEDLAAVVDGPVTLDSFSWYRVRRTVEVPASKLTFAGMEPRQLVRIQRETAFELSQYPSFAGFAVHHEASWRDLFRRPR